MLGGSYQVKILKDLSLWKKKPNSNLRDSKRKRKRRKKQKERI
jgi:hypothetical protein